MAGCPLCHRAWGKIHVWAEVQARGNGGTGSGQHPKTPRLMSGLRPPSPHVASPPLLAPGEPHSMSADSPPGFQLQLFQNVAKDYRW